MLYAALPLADAASFINILELIAWIRNYLPPQWLLT